MSFYQLGQALIHNPASGVLDELIAEMNKQCEIPIVYSPVQDYEECVEHYRAECAKRYKTQVRDLPNTPSLIGWRRMALRRHPSLSGDRNVKSALQPCAEFDMHGKPTGNTIPLAQIKSQFRIDFRMYSTDIRMIEAFEIAYLTQTLVSNITSVSQFVPTRNQTVSYPIKWLFDDVMIDSIKTDNHYHSLEFACEVDTDAISSLPKYTTGDVAKGLGSDGNLKDVRGINEKYEIKAATSNVIFPNSNPNSSEHDPYAVVADNDINRRMLALFKQNK